MIVSTVLLIALSSLGLLPAMLAVMLYRWRVSTCH